VPVPDTTMEQQRDEVTDVVHNVFAAMAARDCARLESLVAGTAKERLTHGGGCAHVLETEPASMDIALVRMEPPRRDGRVPGTWMVRALTRNHHEEQPVQIRVQWTNEGFRLVNM